MREYSLWGLFFWPQDSVSTVLLALLRTKGPTEDMIRVLLARPGLAKAQQAEIVAAALPYLESEWPRQVEGAIASIDRTQAGNTPETFEAELHAAERVLTRTDVQNRYNLLNDLLGPASAPIHDARVHALLLKLAGERLDSNIAVYLARFGDPSDLPRLTAMMTDSAPKDQFVGLPQEMTRSFGAGSVPYLKTALRASPGRFTNRELALAAHDSRRRGGFPLRA